MSISNQKKKGKKYRYTARTADRHRLYEIAVQCPEADVEFLDNLYKDANGRRPLSLMEDFCGTSLLSTEWVKSLEGRTAVGVDIDADVLEWARRHNIARLGDLRENVTLLQKSVMDVTEPKVDLRVGFNFSFSTFVTRPEMLRYFRTARSALNPGGIFVIDLHGGPEAQEETVERKKMPGFRYIWEQGELNPIDQRMECYIHFEFPDRSRMKKAFVYKWRLWGLMELRELMGDAGFGVTEVYWEGTDPDTDEGDGNFERCSQAENDPSWITYLVGKTGA